MPMIEYVAKRFTEAHQAIIARAVEIIDDYQAQGFTLTVRQIYYQFVQRGWLANKQREYKRLGGIINDARLAGLIDWYAIEDRTRFLRGIGANDDARAILDGCPEVFKLDMWEHQPCRIEVWIEKDALIGVLDRVCSKMQVDYFSCRGYPSQSEVWKAGQRMAGYVEAGQTPYVLHLGDHDPSGIDMTRDIFDRLQLFMGGTEVKRLALNMDQVRKYNPVPNPTKPDDSRYKSYVRQYGDECWELDALEPKVMAKLIEKAVRAVRDDKQWKADLAREEHGRAQLEDAVTYATDWLSEQEEYGD